MCSRTPQTDLRLRFIPLVTSYSTYSVSLTIKSASIFLQCRKVKSERFSDVTGAWRRILEADRKAFFIFSHKRKYWRKWNYVYGRKWNENGHSFSAGKNENESHPIILVFFSFSYIQSPNQSYNTPPIPRPVSPFLQVVLVDGIPLSSCRPEVYRYLCGIFLDDISTREQYAFLVYCYWVKAIFHDQKTKKNIYYYYYYYKCTD